MPTEETSTTKTAIQEPQAKQEPANKVRKIIKFLNGKKVIKRTCSKDGFRYDPKTKRCIKLRDRKSVV